MLTFARLACFPVLIISFLLLQACATSTGSRADFAIPDCENAWNKIAQAHGLESLHILIGNDCANLYQQGWRLPINQNRGGTVDPQRCDPAWNSLKQAAQLENVKFMVTHNCPVFYRHGWIIPPR